MRLYFLFVLAILFSCQSKAANDPPPAIGARAVALGYAYQGIRGDYWSLYHNPAGIAGVEKMTAGAYVVRRFNLKELTSGSAGLVLPFLEGEHTLGLDMTTFGFSVYRENRIGLTYATTLLDKVSLGVKLNYASLAIANYGSESSLYVDVGVNAKISSQLSFGFSATNVNRAKLGQDPAAEALPTVVTAGLAYQPSDRVLLVADVQKDVDHPLSVRGGLEYYLNDFVIARIGVSNEPLSWQMGLGLVKDAMQIDFAFGYTDRLGYSPHISLSYAF
jgi:hypothetical protein